MRKAFLIAGLALTAAVLFLLGSVTYVLFDIDGVIRDTAQNAASSAYKVSATVDSATMSLKNGKGHISGVKIPNPPGFTAAIAIDMPQIDFTVDTGRPAAAVMSVAKAVIDKPRVTLEIVDGRANLAVLRASARAWAKRAVDAAKGQRFVLENLWIQHGTLAFRADFAKGETDVPMPDTRIRDIGGKETGALPAELISAVTETLMTAVERASRRLDLAALAKAAGHPAPTLDLTALLKN